nr:RNA-directed DNA polymerase, eukaryota, reverse transcriptase zinc-binding domain protein [Tanacetum cinerariifolium]
IDDEEEIKSMERDEDVQKFEKNVQESKDSLEHPPGFTPVDGIKENMDSDVADKVQNCQELKTEQCNNLESDVTNVEINKAVWDCGTDKAPGPDGFTFGFFRQFWYLVDREIYDVVRL